MPNWIWIVGGGILQVPLITQAQKEGYKVFVTDQNESAPGIKLADNSATISTYDEEAHKTLAHSMKEKPVAVLTAGADVGPTVSAIAEVFDLHAAPFYVAKNCQDKIKAKEILSTIQEHPAFLSISYADPSPRQTWKRFNKDKDWIPFPCVVKPSNSSGSKGVILVGNHWQLETAIREARKYAPRPKVNAIIEEYISGPEVSLDFFVVNSRMKLINASYRQFGSFAIEKGFLNPWTPPKEVLKLCRQTRMAFGVTWGPLKIDLMYTEQHGWLVMELATRLSGGFDHSHAATMLGKDITSAMLELAITGNYDRKKVETTNKNYVFVASPEIEPGPISNVLVNKKYGKVIYHKKSSKLLKNCTDRAVWIASIGSTPFQAYRKSRMAVADMEIIR